MTSDLETDNEHGFRRDWPPTLEHSFPCVDGAGMCVAVDGAKSWILVSSIESQSISIYELMTGALVRTFGR